MSVRKPSILSWMYESQHLRFWLFWLLLFACLAYGVHRYFEYRTMELDRRLELLK